MVLWMNAELGLTVNDSGYTAKKEFHKFFTSEFDTQITVWMGKKNSSELQPSDEILHTSF